MEQIQVFVQELFKEKRTFLVDSRFTMEQFLKEISDSEHHHYERSFFSIENNCFVDLKKSFQENHIVSFDHLVLV
ncbi:MAG: hypothetical protein KBT48_10090 [Firmicutes bacterium]|nr:hypothetical protein [Bacillota bacterium]